MKKIVALCLALMLLVMPGALAFSTDDIFTPIAFTTIWNANIEEILGMLYPNADASQVSTLAENMKLTQDQSAYVSSDGTTYLRYTSANGAMAIYYKSATETTYTDTVNIMIDESVAKTYLIIAAYMIAAVDEDVDAVSLVNWIVNPDPQIRAESHFQIQYITETGYIGVALAPQN